MLRNSSLIIFFLFVLGASAQNSTVDSLYLEDQFYLGLTYNTFGSKPSDMTHRNLPFGLQFGFIKDMPINKNRTVSIGLGLGYAVNNYYSNLIATKENNVIAYSFADDDTDYKRSKIETHLVELPIEFRWRKSTPTDYKFLRIYGGVKFGYAFSARSKFVSDELKESFSNDDIDKIRYGLQFNMGYNTWNVHVYYGLNSLLDGAAVNGEDLSLKPIRVGFNFYIL